MTSLYNPIFVALDVPDKTSALSLVEQLRPHVDGFKIGLELYLSEGKSIVEEIGAHQVFLDLKLHDIPNTVACAMRVVAKLGVQITNVHCLGGLEMMLAANDAVKGVNSSTRLIGVTVLTSHDKASLARLGLDEEPQSVVRRLARLAQEAGLDGVVCSPQEIVAVREECGEDFLLVTPGIRPATGELGDQKRVLTPRQAVDLGANYLVIGRPITSANDPMTAAQE
ncbi:MAG TPA: orotidine-5'-phosphate decarboxylase, partial [Abditibacteriaceae bacterium]|nr:orotidine-5'-phosphate decarboxylase [Abditibacteriaceae bacterium]